MNRRASRSIPPRRQRTHANRFAREAMLTGVLAILAGCATTPTVDSLPKSDILVLSSDYALRENRGPGPVEIASQENLVRFGFQKDGLPLGYLLVMFPGEVDGTISVKLSTAHTAGTAGFEGDAYLDKLLRAHRMLLKGDLVETERLVRRMENDYDTSYGTAVLLGDLALLQGNQAEAAKQFKWAFGLFPETEIEALFPAAGQAK